MTALSVPSVIPAVVPEGPVLQEILRTAAEGSTSAAKKKALLKEADEREGYASHLAGLRDADEPKESTEQKEESCTSCPTPAPSA